MLAARRFGAEGIGLYRSEFLYLSEAPGFPGEEAHYRTYRELAEKALPHEVVIRTLDLGGEKYLSTILERREPNPVLGLRGVRLCLKREDLFRTQIRGIFRASAHGKVRLMFPMISGLEELRRARAIVDEVKGELLTERVPCDPGVPIGIMIEVPAAALIADRLAEVSAFFSIGTNDLTQYTLAVDRGNEHVAHLYEPLHPAVLTLIDRTARAADRHGIPVTVCGEMASNPLAVPILVGIGISELSGTPSAIPVMKEIVRALDSGELAADAREALRAGTPAAVRAISAARIREAGLLEHPDIGSWLQAVVS
jgi:phosphotransferase system enzyme I (PtsI)